MSRKSGPGRKIRHRLVNLEIPSDFEIPECESCGARPMNRKLAEQLDGTLEILYRENLSRIVREDLAALAKVKPLYQWERELGLSVGYLSKVKDEAPKSTLVALVRLLANDPRRTIELAALWSGEGNSFVKTLVESVPVLRIESTGPKSRLENWSLSQTTQGIAA